jgi:hypothetical protein
MKMRFLGGRAMGQSSGLSPRAELDAISGSPGVSPSRVFIRRGELEKYMEHFHENARFGCHAGCAVCGKRGLVKPTKTHGSRRPLSPTRSPWLPLPFSSAMVNLKRSCATFISIASGNRCPIPPQKRRASPESVRPAAYHTSQPPSD